MNSRVRIVKHRKNDGSMNLPIGKDEKTQRQSDREIVATVKSWIAELEQRRRASKHRRANGFK